MKSMKRSISILLILIMMLCIVPYAGAQTEYLDFEATVLELRKQMVARNPEIVLHYKTAELPTVDMLNALFGKSMEHTGNPAEGDYLEKHIREYRIDLTGFQSSGQYELTLHVDYYTNAAQEQAVEAAVTALLQQWNFANATDYEKIRTIYQYITETVRYDYANLKNQAYTLKYSAYAALFNKTAVCQGYANLFYRLALAAGLDCRIIAGHSRSESHAWNIVKLGGLYYNLDATWDEGKAEYNYFLKGARKFNEHAENPEYKSPSFKAAYPISAEDYVPGAPQPVPTPDPVPPFPFSDVAEKNYCRQPVAWAVQKGVTTGTSATTFSPNQKCTRGQVVTFLWRAAGSPEPQSQANPFTDIKPKDYYYKAVLWAVEQGITTGMSPTTFAPNSICNRAQVATFLWRSADEPAVGQAQNPFTDVKSNAYYFAAVLWAVEQEVTNGMAPGQFAPNADCTRGQIVTFLYRHFN